MAFYVYYKDSDGTAVSMGRLQNPTPPAGISEKSYPGNTKPSGRWDAGTLDFVEPPPQQVFNARGILSRFTLAERGALYEENGPGSRKFMNFVQLDMVVGERDLDITSGIANNLYAGLVTDGVITAQRRTEIQTP
jgi:hypothetical protein